MVSEHAKSTVLEHLIKRECHRIWLRCSFKENHPIRVFENSGISPEYLQLNQEYYRNIYSWIRNITKIFTLESGILLKNLHLNQEHQWNIYSWIRNITEKFTLESGISPICQLRPFGADSLPMVESAATSWRSWWSDNVIVD